MYSLLILILSVTFFLLSFFLTYLYKKWAIRQSILDIPNERSSHLVATPRGGGICIVIVFYLGLTFLFLYDQIDKSLLYALLPGIVLAFVGFIDDIQGLTPVLRFSAQFLCSGIALFFLGGFEVPFKIDFRSLYFIIALLGMIWFINLFNFLDGSDGYASMEAISIALCLWFFTGMNLLLFLAFSIGGFLYWNWPRAKIFMGDSGSTVLGYILVVFGIYFQNNGTLSFFFWILITALFWFDATITIIRRAINKERLSKAHKNHIYQRAIQGGFSHLKTMLLGLSINIVLFLIGVSAFKHPSFLFPGFLFAIFVLWLAMNYVDRVSAYKK